MFEGELSTPRDLKAGVPQGSDITPTLYTLYINDTLQTPGVYLVFSAYDTYVNTSDGKLGYVLRKLQSRLFSMGS